MKFKNLSLSAIVFTAAVLGACSNEKKPDTGTHEAVITGNESFSDSASSFIRVIDKDGKVFVQKTNTDYELITGYAGKEKRKLLIKITKAELSLADSASSDKVFNVVTRDITNTSVSDPSYELNFNANDIEFRDNTLLATRSGTNTDEDYISRYNLITGKEVFSCSYGSVNVGIPNVKDKRFIGYTSKSATGNPLKDIHEENLFAVISYSSSEAAISKLKLKVKRSPVSDKLAVYTPEMMLLSSNAKNAVVEDGKMVILMAADEKYTAKDVSGFAVQYTFYFGDDNESTKITIPVVDDKFDLSKASFDKDLFDLTAF